MLFILMLLAGLVGNLLTIAIWSIAGSNFQDILASAELSTSQRVIFRISLMVNHACMFLIPAFIFGMIYHSNEFLKFLSLKVRFSLSSLILWGLLILASYPLVAYFTLINEMIPLPEWASSSQDDAFRILGKVLRMDNSLELLLTVFLVGVLPAVGEELIFRGIVQQKMISLFRNPHLAILGSSIIFGLVHFQLERFIPLTFLGIILGYSFYYTQSLLVPIILHFLNNAFQVLSFYFSSETSLQDIDQIPDLPTSLIVGSAIITISLLYLGARMSPENYDR